MGPIYYPTVIVDGRRYRAPHRRDCRDLPDGAVCYEDHDVVYRKRTANLVPVH